jgi:hypothetical protein
LTHVRVDVLGKKKPSEAEADEGLAAKVE